jgi:hypothetical protein
MRVRWVNRVGIVDTPVVGDFQILAGQTHRFRLQFGVFDDATSPAPAGGFAGWNVGVLDATGGTNSRTPGRIAPFNFAPGPPGGFANGFPAADPWTHLTLIDNTLGTQSPTWTGGIPGTSTPNPIPLATIRGRNTFVSIWELTTNTGPGTAYDITASGNGVPVASWEFIGQPNPPLPGDDGIFGPGDANGDGVDDGLDDLAGSVTYGPFAAATVAFNTPLHLVPAPGAAALLGLGGLIAFRRRRN